MFMTKYRFIDLKSGALKELNLYFVDASYTLPVKPRVTYGGGASKPPCGSLKIVGCKASETQNEGTK